MVNILIGCTGSVASIKLPVLAEKLIGEVSKHHSKHVCVRVVTTKYAQHFFLGSELPTGVELYDDKDEWSAWSKRGDPVLHIELRKWADIFVIAPLDANTLAKIANGLCDNLLTCVARAWDMSKPLLFCPTMNTMMYTHPITEVQISTLQKWGFHLVAPIEKTLMCGDTGTGAMAEVDTIIEHVIKVLSYSSTEMFPQK